MMPSPQRKGTTLIPTAPAIHKQGSLDPVETIGMTFDPTATAHILSVLTNLYSDPQLAVLREYSTNAYDSHIEAGIDRPIEVTLPTPFLRELSIQDFGVGLSVDDLRNIYSRYGSSTKRGTNAQNGMLGLGSKSALTYAQSFTITAVKNGVRCVVAVSLNKEGIGQMDVIDTCATSDPNGVKITIPVKDVGDFASTARTFYSYWKPGTVLVNGSEPERHEGDEITENLYLIRSNSWHSVDSKVVMGNVAYPLTSRDFPDLSKIDRSGIVLYAPIGSIDFVPSREALHMTEKTKTFLGREINRAYDEIVAYFEKEISQAENATQALVMARRCRTVVGNAAIQWRGKDIPDDHKVLIGKHYLWHASNKRGSKSESFRFAYSYGLNPENVIVVHDTKVESISRGVRDRAIKWADENGVDRPVFVFTDDPGISSEWLRCTTYDTIKAVNIPRAASVKGPTRQADWDVFLGTQINSADISGPVAYASNTEFENYSSRASFLEGKGYTVLIAGLNRHERLTREIPQAIHFSEAITLENEKTLGTLSRQEILDYLWFSREPEWARLLVGKADALDNGEMITRAAGNYNKVSKILGGDSTWGIPQVTDDDEKRIVDDYPLLDGINEWWARTSANLDLVVEYMNTTTRNEGN
jgi:hypothetical protein